MNIYQRYFYFGKNNKVEEETTMRVGWQEEFLYRFVIDEEDEVVVLETKDGQKVNVNFEHVYLAIAYFEQVQSILLSSLIGAPNPLVKNE